MKYSPPRWVTLDSYCSCGHHRDVHERFADGTYRNCTAIRGDGGQCVCLRFEAKSERR